MPSSMAACMTRTDSASSLMERMCQPPRHTMETRSLVRPSSRVGTPVADALDVCAITRRARVATDALAAARFTKSLREVVLGITLPPRSVYCNRSGGPEQPRAAPGLLRFTPCSLGLTRLGATGSRGLIRLAKSNLTHAVY